MTTSAAVTVTDAYATMGGIKYQLCVTTRITDNAPAHLSSEKIQGMVAHTIATWQRAMQAVLTDTWEIAQFGGKVWPSAEEKQGVTVRDNHEPYVTVWNKGGASINITVQSWDNGTYALETAKDTLLGLAKFKEHSSAFGFESFEYATIPLPKAAPAPKAPQNAPKQVAPTKDINNVDDFIPPYSGQAPAPQAQATPTTALPFRYFKQIAPNVIQLQEWKPNGGGEHYVKSAIESTLPYDKKTAQYDEGALIYFPITGKIQIKEGQYGRQAIIPTARGRVYVNATDKDGKEKPEWHNLAQDLHTEYDRLNADDNAELVAPQSVLVLKAGNVEGGTQWKNYYHIYQALLK